MKRILALILVVLALGANAQTSRPPGTAIGTIDSATWNGATRMKGSTFKLMSGGTVYVDRIEKRLVGMDTCTYAVSQSGRYYAMDEAAERHSGGRYAYPRVSLARPGDDFRGDLFDAGRSLRMYQGLKLASFGTGLASVITIAVIAGQDTNPRPGSNTGAYMVAGALAGAGLVFSFLADGQVFKAGRLLQIASGKIPIGAGRR